MLSISERFVAQCSPVIGSNYDTCGTVTRSYISHLTPSQLDDIFRPSGLFADLDAWFKHSIEMKACGVKQHGLYDWIMANADRTMYRSAVTGIKAVKSESLLQPFIFGRQESVINNNYWRVVDGFAIPATSTTEPTNGTTDTSPLSNAGTTVGEDWNYYDIVNEDGTAITYNQATVQGTTRLLRLDNRGDIPMDAGWFRHGEVITVFTRHANGLTQLTRWKVLNSVVVTCADDAEYVDVSVLDMNGGSTTAKNLTPSSSTGGVVVPGLNNVNDYEKWCQNRTTIDPRKRVPFWVQTTRTTRCVDSEYRAVYKRLFDTNPAFREFGDLPLAERNRQDEVEFQKRFVNDFFFNLPISANQTTTLWQSLETINTVEGASITLGLSGKPVAKRANFVGVREQLRLCDRVFDLQNQQLNLLEFFDLNYNIMRARQTQGRTVKDIDWWMNSTMKAYFATAMMGYYKENTLEQFRVTAQFGQESPTGWAFDSYYVKRPAGVRINILSDFFFDDLYDEFNAQSLASLGNYMLCLDIGKPGASGGTIYWAMIAANRKAYTSAQIEELAKIDSTFRCVMEHVSIEQTLFSQSGTVVVECPLASAWIEGVADLVPKYDEKSPSYSDTLYKNLY